MLKDLIVQDMGIFFNTEEFAEMHRIGDKLVRCIIDNDRLLDLSKKYYDGTLTAEKLVYVEVSLLDSAPEVGKSILFDNELTKVYAVIENDGIFEIMLEKPIGKLDKNIIIQRSTITKVNGYQVENWTDFCVCKAYIRNLGGNETFKASSVVGINKCLMKIAYVEGIIPSMRVYYRQKYYNIKHIDNTEENNEFIDLICEVVE